MSVLTRSLRAAVAEMLDFAHTQLGDLYAGEQIELRPGAPLESHVYRCFVNGTPVGEAVNLLDSIGLAILHGVGVAQERLVDRLSHTVMMHLQTM